MKRNIIFEFIFLLLIVTTVITVISLNSLRSITIDSSINNAQMISKIYEDILYDHSKDENLKHTDMFLKNISELKDIKEIRVVRSEKLSKTLNHNKYKNAKDAIDNEVLASGKMKYVVENELINTSLRVTFPYNMSANKNNCVNCHSFNEGETISALTVVMDVSKLKESGIKSIYLIVVIILIAILIIFLFSKKIFGPYVNLYNRLKDNINDAKKGKFSSIAIPAGLNKETIEITEDYNNLIELFEQTSTKIDEKLQGFVEYRDQRAINSNPLEESKDIIDNLSNLYQFKKLVELDNTKEEIYNRITEVFKNKFGLKNFTFFEVDNKKQKINIVSTIGESLYCMESIKNSPDLCRASRTKNDVFSIDHHNSCPYYNKKDKFYYCINIDITKDLNLIIHFTTDTKDELEEIKYKSAFIKRYLKEAAPSIEVKLLMFALQESAFTDGLTGLYNRKYLEESLKKLIPQVKRNEKNIGLLMLDMDHFKAVNDEYGHDIGDKVLKELARILTENVRESDILVRYGGEEFMVLLIGVKDEIVALEIANKIGAKVRENEIDVYAGATIKKTVSIGLSMYPQDAGNFENVIKNADIALYEAKSSGRDKVVRFKKEQLTEVELF